MDKDQETRREPAKGNKKSTLREDMGKTIQENEGKPRHRRVLRGSGQREGRGLGLRESTKYYVNHQRKPIIL